MQRLDLQAKAVYVLNGAHLLGDETEFDYQMEQQIRAILWAAHHEPKAEIQIQAQQNVIRTLPPLPPERLRNG